MRTSECMGPAGIAASLADLGAPGLPSVDRYRAIRAMTERLAEPLSAEDCQVQPMPDASPVKWHLAHTTWFFETFLLVPHVLGYKVFHESFNYLLNSYYNAVGRRLPRPERGLMTRPGLAEVKDYRAAVDAAMLDFLSSADGGRLAEVAPVIELGLNHEQQHQELIVTDIKYTLAQNPLRPAYRADAARPREGTPPPRQWRTFRGGLQSIGHEGSGFCFDNEGPRHRVYLEDFELASRATTNRRLRRVHATTAAIGGPNSGFPTAGTASMRAAGKLRSTGSKSTAPGGR